MAKSSGNFITIKDFLAKYLDADILKLFFLSAHYSHPIDYNEAKIEETKQALSRLHILMDKLSKIRTKYAWFGLRPKVAEIESVKAKFLAAMDDDFNTPEALAAIYELANLANKNIDKSDFIAPAARALKDLLGIFGITLAVKHGAIEVADGEIKEKIAERNKAREGKNFKLADDIRKSLESQGVILEDTKEGTTWRRKL